MPEKNETFYVKEERVKLASTWKKGGLTYYLGYDAPYEDIDKEIREAEFYEDYYPKPPELWFRWNYLLIMEGERMVGEFILQFESEGRRMRSLTMTHARAEALASKYNVEAWKGAHWVNDELNYPYGPYLLSDNGFKYFEENTNFTYNLPDGTKTKKFDLERFRKLYDRLILPAEEIYTKHRGIAGTAIYYMDPSDDLIDLVLLDSGYMIGFYDIDRVYNEMVDIEDRRSKHGPESAAFYPPIRMVIGMIEEVIKKGVNSEGNYSVAYEGEAVIIPGDAIQKFSD